MVLSGINEDKGFTRFYVEEYLREDFISRGLIVTTNEKKVITSLAFNSSRFGTMTYSAEKGLISCFGWETEDTVKNLSTISKHYVSLFQNSEFQPEIASLIYADIKHGLDDPELEKLIDQFIVEPDENAIFDPAKTEVQPKKVLPRKILPASILRRREKPPEPEEPKQLAADLEKVKPAFDLNSRKIYRSCSKCYHTIFISEMECKHCGYEIASYRIPRSVESFMFRYLFIPALLLAVGVFLLIMVGMVVGL